MIPTQPPYPAHPFIADSPIVVATNGTCFIHGEGAGACITWRPADSEQTRCGCGRFLVIWSGAHPSERRSEPSGERTESDTSPTRVESDEGRPVGDEPAGRSTSER